MSAKQIIRFQHFSWNPKPPPEIMDFLRQNIILWSSLTWRSEEVNVPLIIIWRSFFTSTLFLLFTFFFFFYHQPSDCSQKPKLFPWFNDTHPWRVCSAEPGTGMCLNSVFDGISQFETRTERTLSDTLETQHLRFLLHRFCCYCKTFTFCFLTRLKFKLNICRRILQTGVSKTRLWSETHGLLLYDETKHWFGSDWNYISNT